MPRGGSPTSLYTNRTWEIICGEARWAVEIARRMVDLRLADALVSILEKTAKKGQHYYA